MPMILRHSPVDNLWITMQQLSSSHLVPPRPGRGQKPNLSSSRVRISNTDEDEVKDCA